MHILLIHQNFAALDEPGGTRHHELSRYLAGRGHRITIITSPISYLTGTARSSNPSTAGQLSPDQPGDEQSLIAIRRAYMYPALHRSFFHRVLSFLSFMVSSFWMGIRIKGVDLVWGTSPPIFQGLTAWAIARWKRVPFVFEVRDLWPAFAVQVGVLRQPALIWATQKLERFLYQHADQLVVNSPGFVDHVRVRGARRVEVIPNGADSQMFHPQEDGKAFILKYAPALEGKFIALYAGAHGLSNDLGVVLEAARLLADQPEVAIVFLGDGKDKPLLVAQAAEMGLENVTFLPPVPKIEIPQALAAAGACIAILKPLPLYATVYPNKVFDYMAAGRPVVLAIEGVIREVVEKAGAGLPVPPGNPVPLAEAIRWLADHPEERCSMGARGRSYLESHFDRAYLAAKLADLFESL
jgi:glycosyltransferase involved in cell wall biosynthesis